MRFMDICLRWLLIALIALSSTVAQPSAGQDAVSLWTTTESLSSGSPIPCTSHECPTVPCRTACSGQAPLPQAVALPASAFLMTNCQVARATAAVGITSPPELRPPCVGPSI